MNADDCRTIATKSVLPGRPFLNRVLLQGTLTTGSPLHIGCGEELDHAAGPRKMVVDAAVETDSSDRPVIPGSAIKGALRTRLGRALPHGERLVGALLGRLERDRCATAVGRASKVDFFDAVRSTVVAGDDLLSPAAPPHWDPRRGTFVLHSVSLTDEGVAKEHHLFSLEVVPQGTSFAVELWGRNMADEEIALLMWLLDGFNDEVAPVMLGGHTGRGFGRLVWTPQPPRVWGARKRLLSSEPADGQAAAEWFDGTVGPLRELVLSRPDTALDGEDLAALRALASSLDELAHAEGSATSVALDVELELLSDLLVRGYPSERAGDDACFRLNTGSDKYRGREGDTHLTLPAGAAPAGTNGQVGSLALSVRLDDEGVPHAVFELPGSSLRGAMRAVCERYEQSVVESLFGTTEAKGRISFDALVVDGSGEPLAALYEGMPLNGTDAPVADPAFVLKNRAPHDRMVGGVKHGGPHTFLAVRRGSTLRGRMRIADVADGDLAAVTLWRDRLNSGVARLGGAGAEGDGRVAVSVTAIGAGGKAIELPLPEDSLVDAATPLVGWAPVVPLEPPGPVPPVVESREHYAMNPYDFVPFPRDGAGALIEPVLWPLEDWEAPPEDEELGLLSGCITVRCEVLQPVFVGGRWVGAQHHGHWQFHRAGAQPAIPGASIRGMLRSYIEAAWNGWVSVYTRNDPSRGVEPYAKSYQHRYCGFNSDTTWSDPSGDDGRGPRKPAVPQSLPEPFVPRAKKARKTGVDLASFLFGIVLDPEGDDEEGFSLRSRLLVGDAVVGQAQLAAGYWYPDVARDALLGGAKPVKSSMLYFDVAGATVKKRTTANRAIAQFTAGPFRGRKFYFHQDWERCAGSYGDAQSDDNCWARQPAAGAIIRRGVEAVKPGESVTFEVWFDRLPPCCLDLLLEALSPSSGIVHKLGGLKAFGYGSVRLHPVDLRLYSSVGGRVTRCSDDETLFTERPQSDADHWVWACDPRAFTPSDRHLRYLLTYPAEPAAAPIFCYPAFGSRAANGALEKGFAVANAAGVLRDIDVPRAATVDDIAAYYDLPPGDTRRKITQHLGLLQRGSRRFPTVLHRALRDGEKWEDLATLVHRDAIP